LCFKYFYSLILWGNKLLWIILSIGVFYGIAYTYFKNYYISNVLKFLHLLLLLLTAACFAFHIIPGFHNDLVLDKILVSSDSMPFSMYLNFDKTMVGIILFLSSNLYDNEKSLNLKSFALTLLLAASCSLLIMILGVLFGYIKFDFKIPNIIFIWCLNNLFFVCFTEEILFRGIIQNQLKRLCLDKYIAYIHLILASLIFGLAHFKGGELYVLLAFITSIFYGFAYEITGRILCAILVHFYLNFIHIIFFTYPMATKSMTL
jgi:uncharacterized protein